MTRAWDIVGGDVVPWYVLVVRGEFIYGVLIPIRYSCFLQSGSQRSMLLAPFRCASNLRVVPRDVFQTVRFFRCSAVVGRHLSFDCPVLVVETVVSCYGYGWEVQFQFGMIFIRDLYRRRTVIYLNFAVWDFKVECAF